MGYTFSPHTNTGVRSGSYSVTIGRSGIISFNTGFFVKENLDRYSRVRFFFDEDNKALAIQFAHKDDKEGTFSLNKPKNGRYALVTPTSFIKKNNLTSQSYFRRWTPKKYRDPKYGEMWVIDLNEKEFAPA